MWRAIENVLEIFEQENHVPMAKLVEALGKEPCSAELSFDVSMLRLWIARTGIADPEVMITYGDGRGGGHPSPPFVDVYELTFLRDSKSTDVATRDMASTLKQLVAWLASTK